MFLCSRDLKGPFGWALCARLNLTEAIMVSGLGFVTREAKPRPKWVSRLELGWLWNCGL